MVLDVIIVTEFLSLEQLIGESLNLLSRSDKYMYHKFLKPDYLIFHCTFYLMKFVRADKLLKSRPR